MESNKLDNSIKLMLGVFFIVLIWSAIKPHSFITWVLEALPAIIMVLVLALTYKKFKFSNFAYFVVLVHTVILLVGAKYTYQRNPLFDYFMERWDLSRNYYDRVGHYAQGFTPAIMAKELLLKKKYFKKGKMFYFIVICIVLGIAAAWELVEFAAARIGNVPGESILSTQGDPWDTQWDMIMALLGAGTALIFFKNIHEKHGKIK
ncbi:MAG: DUF2238 domain-containing protein [Tissierellia bacterium]|jgi:putative membrane protein|nr:DUF2238 domain-containing protein [Tissierellia bacterium]